MEGLRRKICASTRHRGEDKTKGEFQVQDSIKLQHESQFHWLGYCLALLEDLESIYKKTPFLLFNEWREVITEEKLLLFPVVKHHIKVVRDGGENKKIINTNDQSRLSTFTEPFLPTWSQLKRQVQV